jgi:hypothetical protein
VINGDYRGSQGQLRELRGGVCYSPWCNSEATIVPGSSYIGHARRWGLCSSRGLFVNSRARFVRVVRVSPVCFSVLVAITVHLLP